MININVALINPWAKEKFKNLFCKSGIITGYKAWEFEVCNGTNTLVSFEFDLFIRRRDHAGLSVTLGLLGYLVSAQIYDTRHWDHELDSWKIYD